MRSNLRWLVSGSALALLLAGATPASAGWTSRMADAFNTGNVGNVPALTEEKVSDLEIVDVYDFEEGLAEGNATPIATEDGLVFWGDWEGFIHVIDIDAKAPLIRLNAFEAGVGTAPRGAKVQATAELATVTVPDGEGGTREEERAYVPAFGDANRDGLYCFSIDRIREDRETLAASPSDGKAYLCDGADWPLPIMGPTQTNSNQDGSGLFSRDQPILIDGEEVVRDVLYMPSSGQGGSTGGETWALDAYTGEKLWVWASPDPMIPSTMWSAISMNRDRTIVYITTSDFTTTTLVNGIFPPLGGRGASIVAIDARTGEEVWYYQYQFVDTQDLDVGNGVTVVDVEGPDGCHLVVNPSKDGCIWAFPQEADLPEVGDPDYDPLRPDQQRIVWHQCFVPGSLQGGFLAMHASFDGRRIFGQVRALLGHVPGDEANAFALDACTGELEWASSSIPIGGYDGALASGMFFQQSDNKITVVRATDGEVLATVPVTGTTSAGGGVSILPDGRILAARNGGVIVMEVAPGSNSSPPVVVGNDSFAGPYPVPINTTVTPKLPLPSVMTETQHEREFHFEILSLGDALWPE